MHNRCLASCALIIVLTSLVGCLFEVSEKPYIVEVDQEDESIQKPPVNAGQMLAGKRLKKAKLKDEKFDGPW